MADVSKIQDINGQTYEVKDSVAMAYPYQRPIATKTYTDVIATSNDHVGAAFFYAKVRATTYRTRWRVKLRVRATVPGSASNADMYNIDSIYEIWGVQNTYNGYSTQNKILSTSYRPIYYHCNFRVSSTGYNNGCGNWLGFSLASSTNQTNASYKRTVIVDLLECQDCEVEMQDTLYTPTNIPDRASHTDWYSSTYSSFDNFDAYSHGYRFTGDQNSTVINHLCNSYGSYIADSAVYRYQLLFHVSNDVLTPLNNDNNVIATTKTMLTNVEFDPFERIYYWNSTTTYAAGGTIAAGTGLTFAYLVDARYTFNCGSTLTAHKNVYLMVTPLTNGKCKIANNMPLTQDLPIIEDGYWYIFLGRASSTYQFGLYDIHPVFMHNGTEIVRVMPKTNDSGGGGGGGDTSDCVHKTGDETIAGAKTFTSTPIVAYDGGTRGLSFANAASHWIGDVLVSNGDSNNPDKIVSPRFYFRQYSGNTTATDDNNGHYEYYRLPVTAAGLASNPQYDIVTTKDVDLTIAGVKTFSDTTASSSTSTGAVIVKGGLGVAKYIYGSRVYNAVWNDYAEFRQGTTVQGGYCVSECEDGWMRKSTKRLQPACRLTSDTYGSCMGETDKAKTPIAVAGRVLAYTYEQRSKFKIGDAVCSGPDGKVSIMSRREIRKYPDRILGIVSEIPNYEVWNAGTEENPNPVKVDGRIWIYVR